MLQCNTLQHTATHCNTLQHTATHYNTLQHTATHCDTLQHTATHFNTRCHPIQDISCFKPECFSLGKAGKPEANTRRMRYFFTETRHPRPIRLHRDAFEFLVAWGLTRNIILHNPTYSTYYYRLVSSYQKLESVQPIRSLVPRHIPNMTQYVSLKETYRVIPGSRNWQVETADWIWPVSSSVL